MMGKIKNKIITLSGEPVSGKGTVAKKLIHELVEQGYQPENIHMHSTGNEFRKYFNSIIELMRNFSNENKDEILQRPEVKELFQKEEYRKIISKTMATLMQNGTDLSHFTIEDANNSEAFDDIRHIVDAIIDEGTKKLGIEINKEQHPEEAWIIDSRLAFANIPDSFAVRLTTDSRVAGKRLFEDKTRGNEDKYSSVEEAVQEREERKIGEIERYKKIYGIDLTDESNYDLVIDTSYSSPESIAHIIMECSDRYQDGEEYAKHWASPEIFVPLQREMDTLGPASYTFEEMVESIKTNGYFPDNSIEVVNVDGVNYIIEGHHRNFGAAYVGEELVPYEVIAKDDEQIPWYSNTARQRADSARMGNLYGHEGFLDNLERKITGDPKASFSYAKIYPELVKRLREKQEIER